MSKKNNDSKKIMITVAEDSSIIRNMLCLIIDHDDRFALGGAFENGLDLISGIQEMHIIPVVCLLDIMMPECNGIETSKILKNKYPQLLIFGYSCLIDGPSVDQMYLNGAKKVFQKGKCTLLQLLDIIYEEYTSSDK